MGTMTPRSRAALTLLVSALLNPGRPEIAYVLLRGESASAASRPARLPRMSSYSPEQVVSVLRAKQRLFGQGRAGRNGVEHE